MTDPIQLEWRSLGDVWHSHPAVTQAKSADLSALAVRQDRESRRLRVFMAVVACAALATAVWLIASTPFKVLGTLLTVLLAATLFAARQLTRRDELGCRDLITAVQDTIDRQQDLVRTAWAGAAVGMAALATVLLAASRLLLIAGLHSISQSSWIALAVMAFGALVATVFCCVRGLLARAELMRLIALHAHLTQPDE
jgi:O-antigen/teichoic acid export membrane protein